jgi:predicted dehydrogenase
MVEHDEAVPMRLGIIGCGWISDWHGRAAAGTPGVEIVACCDARAEAASAFKQRHGCERDYTDYRVMLAEHQLDGIILATWPPHHLEQAVACLDAGIKTILCEKSLTTSGQDALEMFTAAQAAGALVVEGFMYRHHPAMRQVDELLSAGELGVIDNVGAGFEDFDPEEPGPNDPRDWRQRKELGGGVPYDLACYCVNACNHVAGALPTQVMAITRRSSRYDTVHRMYGLIEYENGVVGRITSSK